MGISKAEIQERYNEFLRKESILKNVHHGHLSTLRRVLELENFFKEQVDYLSSQKFHHKTELLSKLNHKILRHHYTDSFRLTHSCYKLLLEIEDILSKFMPRVTMLHQHAAAIQDMSYNQMSRGNLIRAIISIGLQSLVQHYDHPSIQKLLDKRQVDKDRIDSCVSKYKNTNFYM